MWKIAQMKQFKMCFAHKADGYAGYIRKTFDVAFRLRMFFGMCNVHVIITIFFQNQYHENKISFINTSLWITTFEFFMRQLWYLLLL